MKSFLAPVLLCSLSILATTPAFSDDRSEVTEAEQNLRDAMNAKDTAALDRLVSNDLVWISVFGPGFQDKAALLKGAHEGHMSGGAAPEDVRVRIYGIAAVVTAKSRNESRPIYFTRVWVKNGGRWQLVSWHASRAATP